MLLAAAASVALASSRLQGGRSHLSYAAKERWLRRESHPQPRAYQARALLPELLNRARDEDKLDRNRRTCTANLRPVAPALY
jgi:hypothetical protein